ncbi:acyl-CoA dehydrogenase family protein [Tannerella sp.]|uniref:acyl-CoA dehydrogenase family protein n=1 Tax=Tannerella sp. TaxID=2382127 RepID=UPI0026DCCE20|nr:acyl-CoA dehydrogenase family protein [Tannerella sp.]MDO4702839.1 Acyl-CoA dehydrogenase C-terminal domain-containing protein [Tannerella sp.]
MANFYLDTPSLRHHLHHPLMRRIVELKEREFKDKDEYDYAPIDFDDAMDSYERVLEMVGEISAEVIAPNAESVDQEGPTVANGRVTYARGTQENLDAVRKAGLMGMAMPRRYGGLNFPIVPYIMAADIVSRADAGFENLWGLQDCAETLYEFGNEEQHKHYIPRVCKGETMSMDLTEPDAGSDLQSVMLKATFDEKENCWRLNGVKRFITNGDSDIHLVLARSEEGTKDGRGLSMFIYDKRNGGVNVRRIENKMGIKGSPTCELVFNNAKAELCGERRLGLIKYVMALMNGARLGIMAQAVGLCEAAYQEGYKYAQERRQFGKAILDFPAVYEMVAMMRARTDAVRAMLYETARFVDVYKVLDDISRERKLTPEERQEQKKYAKLADAFTPMGKGMSTEFANQNAYDAIQIHGGSGFMKDYACERLYRDARITNIYEGTTQLQVVAAIRHVTTGTYLARLREYEAMEYKPELSSLKQDLIAMTDTYEQLVTKVTEAKDNEYLDFLARRLVEAATHCVFGYLLLQSAHTDDSFLPSTQVYLHYGKAEIYKIRSFIENFSVEDLKAYRRE